MSKPCRLRRGIWSLRRRRGLGRLPNKHFRGAIGLAKMASVSTLALLAITHTFLTQQVLWAIKVKMPNIFVLLTFKWVFAIINPT